MKGYRVGGRGSAFLSEEEKNNKPKITKDLLKRIFFYLKPYWKELFLVWIAIILSAVFSMMPSILTGKIIDEGLIGQDFRLLVLLILASLGVLILSNLIDVFVSYLNVLISQRISFDMKNKMYKKLQSMSHRFFTSSKQGETITRMTSDISGVQSVVSGTLTNILSNIAILVTALIAMYNKNWILASLGLMIVPLFTLPTRKVGRSRWEFALESQKRNDEVNQLLNESLSVSGQLLVKLFTNEEKEYKKYENLNQEMLKLNLRESMAGRWFRVVMSILTNIGPMLIYVAGGILIIIYGNSQLSVGDITVMVALLSRMYRPVNQLLNIQVDLIRSMALFTRIFDYFDMPIEIKNRDNAKKVDSFRGEIEFRNVSFHYEENVPILDNLNFKLEEGKSVAIVGPSGAGKSTIINLLPRLYDVVSGQILIDNKDIRDIDIHSLRKNIGLVTQDSYMFNGSIKEILLYAKANASDEELVEACKKANIHDFIQSLPQGYDSMVGNNGLKLSGGEKQRLSIARVILKDPAILIFDEATSSLDSISESLIQEAIDPLIKSRTSLVIAHRLSTVMVADEIYVLKGGQIVEKGRHEDLMERQGVYSQLYNTQFKHAIDYYENNLEKTG